MDLLKNGFRINFMVFIELIIYLDLLKYMIVFICKII